jgi:hypothetical protein
MKNRLVSLFELDRLLAHDGTRGSATHPERKARRTKVRKAVPAGTARKASKDRETPVAQSFDTGAPIRCEHNVAGTRDTETIQVTGEPQPVSQGLGESYHVEAFEDEEPAEEEPLSATSIEEESRTALRESNAASYMEPEPPPAPRRVARLEEVERDTPASFAAQMAAVETDLNELAARAVTSAPESPSPVTEDDEAAAAPTPPVTAKGHAVFDAMAKGMNYATEFRLPAVQLSQMFDALDRELDAANRKAPASPAVQAPSPTPTAELIKDLVELTPPAKKAAEHRPPMPLQPDHPVSAVPEHPVTSPIPAPQP